MDFWVRDFQTNQCKYMACDMEVSQYEGTPKSSVYNGFSSVNHPDIGVPPFMETFLQLAVVDIELVILVVWVILGLVG